MTIAQRTQIFTTLAEGCRKDKNYDKTPPVTALALRCAGEILHDSLPERVRNAAMRNLCEAATAGMALDRDIIPPPLPDEPSYIDLVEAMADVVSREPNKDDPYAGIARAAIETLKEILYDYSA